MHEDAPCSPAVALDGTSSRTHACTSFATDSGLGNASGDGPPQRSLAPTRASPVRSDATSSTGTPSRNTSAARHAVAPGAHIRGARPAQLDRAHARAAQNGLQHAGPIARGDDDPELGSVSAHQLRQRRKPPRGHEEPTDEWGPRARTATAGAPATPPERQIPRGNCEAHRAAAPARPSRSPPLRLAGAIGSAGPVEAVERGHVVVRQGEVV